MAPWSRRGRLALCHCRFVCRVAFCNAWNGGNSTRPCRGAAISNAFTAFCPSRQSGTELAFVPGVVIGIPNCQGRVSPLFDVAARLTVVRMRGHAELDRREVTLAEAQPAGIARILTELGVDVLICGAISQLLQAALVHAGIRVVPQICGGVEAVVHAYRTGTLEAPEFQMPGCCGRRWNRKWGRDWNKKPWCRQKQPSTLTPIP